MEVVISNVAILASFSLIGWVLSKLHILNSEHVKLLSALEVWVFLPCKTFQGFASNFTIAYLSEKYPILIVSVVVLSALVALNRLLVPIVVKDSYQQNIIRYSLTVPNYGYFGYALVESIWGDLALLNMLIFALPISFYTYTEGYRMLTQKDRVSLKRLINPVFVAVLLGCVFGLMQWELPAVLNSIAEKSAACMAPISMLLSGIMISEYPIREIIKSKSAYVISAMRLLVIPLVLCFVLQFFCQKELVLVAVLLYAMPCGMNTIIFPSMIGEDCRPGASLALISTLCSLITIPICVRMVEWFFR